MLAYLSRYTHRVAISNSAVSSIVTSNPQKNSIIRLLRCLTGGFLAAGLAFGAGRLSDGAACRLRAALNRKVGDVSGGVGGVARSLRMVLQSAILAVGAYLVISQQVTAGVMIASSIMMTRALAPVDLAIANWRKLEDLIVLPDMPAETLIQTGDRTALSYFLKPLSDQFSRAFREE